MWLENTISVYWNLLTLATVTRIKTTGEHIAGLVTELVCQPGVGTTLITVGDPSETS